MDSGEKALYLQIHPLKLMVDIGSMFFAVVLLWQQQLAWGALVAIAPSLLAALVLARWANLESRKHSVLGRYIEQHMTANAQSLRLLGLFVICLGAWYHVALGLVIGLGMIAAGWMRGLLSPAGANKGAE